MNIIFLQTTGVILLLISPIVYVLYKAYKNNKYAQDTDLGKIRYIKEMEMIEGMSGKTNDK